MMNAYDNGEDMVADEADGAVIRYRAPALEKGLDIIELLVEARTPLTMSEICQRLRRSQGEIFRMVQVLQVRGFVEQDSANDGYRLTDKLFTMAMRQPPTQSLVEIALPRMRHLAMEIGQSCHLAFHSQGDIVVVARMESDEQIGFSVRIGHRLRLTKSVSGAVIYAFQPDDIQQRWMQAVSKDCSEEEHATFLARVEEARAKGFVKAASSFVSGVTDISTPIIRGDRASAALTVPLIRHANLRFSAGPTAERLMEAAREISALLPQSDNRV